MFTQKPSSFILCLILLKLFMINNGQVDAWSLNISNSSSKYI